MNQTSFLLPCFRRTLAAILLLSLAACATTTLEDSQRLADSDQGEAALRLVEDAMRKAPGNQGLRIHFYRLREALVSRWLADAERARAAGREDEARATLQRVLSVERDNPRALEALRALDGQARRSARLREVEQHFALKRLAEAETLARALLAEDPSDAGVRALLRRLDEQLNTATPAEPALRSNFTRPITLEFRDTPLRGVFEAISRTAGVNFVFDKDVRADARVTVFVRNAQFEDVIRMVLSSNGLERKLLNENSMLIYPATTAKQREHQELVTRTFYLTNTDVKQAQNLIKTVVKTRDIFIDEKLNLLVMKDSTEAVRMAERLLAQLDVAEPEVMLDVEVLEVLRSRLLNIGLQFPEQIGYGLLQPTTSTSTVSGSIVTSNTNLGGQLQQGNINLRNTGSLVPYAANPGILLNLKDRDGNSNILANPRIRVRNRDKAKIHIGDKLPVFTTTSTANVGVSAAVNYLDVGLKFDVEPIVRLDDEVEIKVGLEVSSVSREVIGPQNSLAYQIGTRNTSTVLRLRDGETQVLAGLISDEERSSAAHLPVLGRIPLLGRLFTNANDSKTKTEIILLITPRILRNVTPPEAARGAQPAGTEQSVGAAPLRIAATPSRSVDVRGGAVTQGQATSAQRATPVAPSPVKAASIALIGPTNTAPGQEFSIQVSANAEGGVRSGEVTVSWDTTRFEALAPASGDNATVSLIFNGQAGSGQLRLRARAGVSGTGRIEISSVRLVGEAGDVPVEQPEALNIQLAP